MEKFLEREVNIFRILFCFPIFQGCMPANWCRLILQVCFEASDGETEDDISFLFCMGWVKVGKFLLGRVSRINSASIMDEFLQKIHLCYLGACYIETFYMIQAKVPPF